ncbi:uncharacterized protein I303_102746 [Kwoniella dejecticola CBS 10117]|uniref:Uncharacterized protein n=1 Tax=Kwoniella dejecticola CBS 10117 TaxID=1296121 RepID=A0AAJ8MEA4_9TREE
MDSPPPYASPTASSANRDKRPRAGAIFGGRAELSPEELNQEAINAGRSVRRTSPRLQVQPQSSSAPAIAANKSSVVAPAQKKAAPPLIKCPICPSFKGQDVFQHIRRIHKDHTFSLPDFPPNTVVICRRCNAVHKPSTQGVANHFKECKVVLEARRRASGAPTTSNHASSGMQSPAQAPATTPSLSKTTLSATAPITPSGRTPVSAPTPATRPQPEAPQAVPDSSTRRLNDSDLGSQRGIARREKRRRWGADNSER